jgi:sterol desaturase/sphingolipid hydroxylase (fatty acid hydroxylase superfamily)
MNPIVLSIPIFFGLIALELIIGWAQGRKDYRLNDAFGNIGSGIFEQVTGLFAKVFTVALYTLTFEHLRLTTVPTTWPWLLVLFLGIDFFYYWAHRMSHEINLFWLGHVVHHQSEEYNLSVALRQGALQKIFTAPFYLPLALIGFDPYWFLYLGALNTLYQFWIHTELIGNMGWFERLFNTPSHHRVHHARNPQYIDKNHAGTLIIWDKLFGTFEPEVEKPVYGITVQTGTFNPVVAHWKPFVDLKKHLEELPARFRWQALWRGPGWQPAEINLLNKGFDPNLNKYDQSLSKGLTRYLLVAFAVLLLYTAIFLFGQATYTPFQRVVGAVLILSSLGFLGVWFDRGRMAQWLEVGRLMAFPLALQAAKMLPGPIWMPWILTLLLAFGALLIAHTKKP